MIVHDPFTAMVIGCGAIALGLILTGAAINWFACTYLRIFYIGVGVCWDDWNIVQKILFLLGLCLWPMAIMLVFIFNIIGWIALIYLGICALRFIFK